MKRLFSVTALTSLLLSMASIVWAASNVNLSRRNITSTEQNAACLEKATTDHAKAACEKKGEGATIAPGKAAPLSEPKQKSSFSFDGVASR